MATGQPRSERSLRDQNEEETKSEGKKQETQKKGYNSQHRATVWRGSSRSVFTKLAVGEGRVYWEGMGEEEECQRGVLESAADDGVIGRER